MRITPNPDALREALAQKQRSPVRARGFTTALAELNALAPAGMFQGGAVHELLWPGRGACPNSLALLIARGAQQAGGAIAWSDPQRELYLPALAAAGIPLRQLILLRCQKRDEELWALAECLRCRALAATVAAVDRLNQLEARRLQLAAERGGGVGIFLRPVARQLNNAYAAATRWLVQPAPGSDQVQRWSVQLVHGHGGQLGKVLLVEVNRETRALCVSPPLADRPAATPARLVTA